MHEYGLCQSIIGIAGEAAGGRRVCAVNLVVGEMSGCAMECVELYFDILAEGTACEGAELRAERAGGREFYVKSIELEGDDDP